MTKIKICGLKRPEDIRAVNEAQPDFAGFVIEVSKSRRNVSVEQVRELAKGLSEQIQAVGVFVNAPLDLVAGLLNDGTLALAQLHGSEDEAYIRQLRQMIDKPLLQAFSIRTEADIERALQSSADYLLLDQRRNRPVLRLVPGAGACKAVFPGGRPRRFESVRSHLPGEALGGGLKQQPGDGWRKGSDKDTGSGENGANTGNRFLIKKTKDRNDQTGRKTRSQHTGGTICQREDLESTEASTFRKH